MDAVAKTGDVDSDVIACGSLPACKVAVYPVLHFLFINRYLSLLRKHAALHEQHAQHNGKSY